MKAAETSWPRRERRNKAIASLVHYARHNSAWTMNTKAETHVNDSKQHNFFIQKTL